MMALPALFSSSIMGAIGTGMQIVGTIAAGRQQAAVASRNAAMMREQAADTARAGYQREEMQRERSGSDLADMRAGLSANGMPLTGSALVGVSQSMRDAEMDALMLRYEGLVESRGQRIAADMEEWQGKAKKRQAYFSAAGQLASAASGYLGGPQRSTSAPVETRTPKLTFSGYGGRY